MTGLSNTKSLFKNKLAVLISFFILVSGYSYFGNYLERSDFIALISIYSGLFLFTFQLLKNVKSFRLLLLVGIVFRLTFIITTPNLSQDFYRFIWDGQVILNGLSPYVFTPEQFILNLPPKEFLVNWSLTQWQSISIPNSDLLYQGMGSLNGSHYSNYPPLNQLCFTIAALLGGKSILGTAVALRVIVVLADIGILYFGKKLLTALKLPVKNIFWYFLNPFIIIELTGNLHFEGVMLFFVIAALYYLYRTKWMIAPLLLGCSISLKLLPLLFLPLFFQFFLKKNSSKTHEALWKKIMKLLSFYALTLLVFIISFIPFASGYFIENFAESIALWFGRFEFNASIYYVIRWIGFQIVGWNIIETVGKILPIVVLVSILIMTFVRKNQSLQQLITALLLSSSIYFLLATTVHPWYVATPLLLGLFTKYKFPIVWSFAIFLSYTAYQGAIFQENLLWVVIEYALVIGYAIWEMFFSIRNRKTTTTLKTS